MRYILNIVLFLTCVFPMATNFSLAEDWQPVTFGNAKGFINPSFGDDKAFAVLGACCMFHFTTRQYAISDLFKYDFQTNKVYYNKDTVIFKRGLSGPVQTYIDSVYFAPTIFFDGPDLNSVGRLYVFFQMRTTTNGSAYAAFNADCFYIDDFNPSQFVPSDAVNMTIHDLSTPDDWIYPLYYYTSPSNFPVTYFPNATYQNNSFSSVILTSASQTDANNLLQLRNPNFSVAWLRASSSVYGSSSGLSGPISLLQSIFQNNYVVYLDSDFTRPAFGAPFAHLGIVGTVTYNPFSYNPQNDFDRGGQCDWSEYFFKKDMLDPKDDSPSIDQNTGDGSNLPIVTPPPRPGESNLEDLESQEIEKPSQEGFTQLFNELSTRMDSTLEQNAGYRSFKRTISQDGFVTKPLPSYQFPMSVSMFGGTMDLGNISIDLNFLREQPFADIWQLIRGILNFSLFTMTFLAVYEMYEKALAWSV